MKISVLRPITASQSRAARLQLMLTQAAVIKQSGLPAHKLKQFESGRFVPDMPFLQKLADFYTGLGVDLSEVDVSDQVPQPAAASPAAKPGADKVRPAPLHRPHFYVSESVTPELLDACLERMHTNDERINEILGKDLRFGLMGSYQEQTVTEQQEIFGAMAEAVCCRATLWCSRSTKRPAPRLTPSCWASTTPSRLSPCSRRLRKAAMSWPKRWSSDRPYPPANPHADRRRQWQSVDGHRHPGRSCHGCECEQGQDGDASGVRPAQTSPSCALAGPQGCFLAHPGISLA